MPISIKDFITASILTKAFSIDSDPSHQGLLIVPGPNGSDATPLNVCQ